MSDKKKQTQEELEAEIKEIRLEVQRLTGVNYGLDDEEKED